MIYSHVSAMFVSGKGQQDWQQITARYEKGDPFFITFDFDECEWEIGRNLLAAGLTEDAGEMDVLVRTRDFRTTLVLDTRNGPLAEVSFPKRWLYDFLRLTSKLVPIGEEMKHIDLDADLRELLNG